MMTIMINNNNDNNNRKTQDPGNKGFNRRER